ncbi:MAG: hypothetical protein ACXVAV_05145 [Ktedonobacteraceae bacterium]
MLKNLMSVPLAICRAILASAFWVASRIFHKVEVHGVKHNTVMPRTYYGILHKRDLDPIIIIPTVVFHRRWMGLAGDLHFALRSDGFTPGFLGRLVMRPRLLSHALRFLSIGPVLRWLGAHPVQDLLRPAEEWVREALKLDIESSVSSVFTSSFIEEFATITGESQKQIASYQLSQLLDWRYQYALQQYYSSEILLLPTRRSLERHMITRIKESITELNAWLLSGGSLFGSPEGHLSPNGKVSPINSGLHRILRHNASDVRIVPISIIYDFMTVRRMRIFVDFAPSIENASQLSTNELDTRLRHAWLQSARITSTQLASGFLVEANHEGLTSFTLDDIIDAMYHQAVKLAKAGRNVDRCLLKQKQVRKRVIDFLAYAERHNVIRRVEIHTWEFALNETTIQVRPREVGYDDSPLVYAWNEVQEILSI